MAMAQEVGQFQIVPIPQPTEALALILDTKNGHLWQWSRAPTVLGTAVSVVEYQGQLTPGQSYRSIYPVRDQPPQNSGHGVRSPGMMAAASTTRAKPRAGLVSRHDIKVLPEDPVQSLDWPKHLEEAALMQWSASGAAIWCGHISPFRPTGVATSCRR
jgi:hypothetical protein